MPLIRDKQKRNKLRQDLYEALHGDGESLSQAVKALRKMLGKDQAAFAEYIGISLATLRKIEQENGNVTMASVHKILDRFSLDLVVRVKKESKD